MTCHIMSLVVLQVQLFGDISRSCFALEATAADHADRLPTAFELFGQLAHVDEPAAADLDPGELPRSALPHHAERAHAEERGYLLRWSQLR